MDTEYAIRLFGALFAIMNPFVNLPIFLSVTEGLGAGAQRAVAAKVALYSAVMGTAPAGVRVATQNDRHAAQPPASVCTNASAQAFASALTRPI